ncbi:acetolactate synthase large subunit [Candidatus Uabimicrobium amorphum]|uniref:Acetolactate synthase n=1 Tax=Uabimicrobium amorphum TaxID=2596890 RepID=A0A5S9IJM5_UABAM|nr:acetolactate synthase large subunit [Candidatus Uabimicrobium amorphum]BBM82260.1 acetolactate synthase [Candidatus Uabimicrobium amorphum]
MKASDLFVKCLQEEGVEYIFGLPGEENADFMISLKKSPIKFILCRHEQAAAFMADVYGRLTGRPGVCLGTLGPGATNLITGVADANMDRAPLICLTGQADLKRIHKESHQAMDVVQMFRPVTKWNTTVTHPDTIPEIVRKAFKIATREKMGACHIELPEDVAALETNASPIKPVKTRRPSPEYKALDQAIKLIETASHPVILAGNGCVRTRVSQQLQLFAKYTGIGVINTFMAKGAIPRKDEHCLFTMGLQSRDHISIEMEKADVVIAVGFDMVEYHPSLWNRGNKKQIINIDFESAEIDENYHVTVDIHSDVAGALWSLNEHFKNRPALRKTEDYAEVRQAMIEDFAEHKDDDAEGVIKPQKVLWDAREVMGENDILLSDVGAHKMWIARYFQCDLPNTCLISNGFCSMGFALPGAIAAKIVYPNSNVLAICGDAGVLMNFQDLETAARINANVVIMVWEDREYGLIKWKQMNHFGEHSKLEFNNPDFVKLAESFGCWGKKVTHSNQVKSVLEEAFSVNKPAIITLDIDYRENLKLTEKLGKIQGVL